MDDNLSTPLEATLVKDYEDDRDIILIDGGATFRHLSPEERTFLANTFTTNRRRHRRMHQQVLRDKERRATKIKRMRNLFLQDRTWAAQGGDILIKDMTPNHAKNSYNLITKEWTRYAGYGISFTDLDTGYPNVHSTPLGQALFKRSQRRTTWLHRRRDNESRERFKDRMEKSRAMAAGIWREDRW